VTQMKEKAQKLIRESRSRSRQHRLANVKDKMQNCLTLLVNKAEELEFEKSIKFQHQGLGKPERILPHRRETMTLEEWLQTITTAVMHILRRAMDMQVDIMNTCKSHTSMITYTT
jgi:hypothetical protein